MHCVLLKIKALGKLYLGGHFIKKKDLKKGRFNDLGTSRAADPWSMLGRNYVASLGGFFYKWRSIFLFLEKQ